MGRQWKTGMPGGVSTALSGLANMSSMMKSVGSGLPAISQFHCDLCGALVQDSLWSKHQMFHQELGRTVQQLASSVGMASSPLIELRQAIAEIDEELAKKNTKVVPRPRKKEEVGYVKPRRSGNPQSTVGVQIPSSANSGDIFVYDAQANMMIPVNGPTASTNVPPVGHPTEPQCEECGKYGPKMNDFATRKNSKGREILIATCEPCYNASRATAACERCGTTEGLTSQQYYNEKGLPLLRVRCHACIRNTSI